MTSIAPPFPESELLPARDFARTQHVLQQEECRTAPPGRRLHARHRPEETLLYQTIEQHYPAFLTHLETEGRSLPRHVKKEFEAYLKCGRLEHGFLRLRCDGCHGERLVALSCKRRGFCPSCAARRMVDSAALLVDEVLPHRPLRQWVLSLPVALRYLCASDPRTMGALLGIAYRAISTHLIKQAGRNCTNARCGAVTLIQRFGGALNLNIHFHMLFLDGVYVYTRDKPPSFQRVAPPQPREVQTLLERISRRMARWLERHGLLQRDMEDSYLTVPEPDSDDSALPDLQAHSLTYRIALGPHRGWRAITVQTVPPSEPPKSDYPLGRTGGFSLHAGLVTEAHQRDRLEHLCRYIARPPLCLDRLSLTSSGALSYHLKTPWRNGTTELLFEPLDFLARLAALVPASRTNLTRYHGVFAPHSAWRTHVTPAKRGSRPAASETPWKAARHRPMTWAERLKRAFSIDVSSCERCGSAMRLLSYIDSAATVQRILAHHRHHPLGPAVDRHDPSRPRGPPQFNLFQLEGPGEDPAGTSSFESKED